MYNTKACELLALHSDGDLVLLRAMMMYEHAHLGFLSAINLAYYTHNYAFMEMGVYQFILKRQWKRGLAQKRNPWLTVLYGPLFFVCNC